MQIDGRTFPIDYGITPVTTIDEATAGTVYMACNMADADSKVVNNDCC